MRAELYLNTLAFRGMPKAGSIQDRIACEMVLRQRRRSVVENVYLGRILSATIQLPEKLFQMWTTMLSMEVFQESYQPEVVKEKETALKLIQENVTQRSETQKRMFRKLQKLTATEDSMRPATEAEVEEFRRKIRRQYLNKAQGKT